MPDASATIDDELLSLRRENERLRHLNAELLATNTQLVSKIERLEGRLDWLVRKLFGRSSERVNPAQGTLFDEPEDVPAPVMPEPCVEEVVVKRKGHGRRAGEGSAA